MGPHLEAALNTLKNNGWNKPENNSHGPSNFLLFKEYLRRVDYWLFIMEMYHFTWMTDLAQELYPDIRLTEDFHNQIRDTLVIYPHTQLLYHNILEWAHLEDHVDMANKYYRPHLSNPYEPLLWMFRRGGAMHYKDDTHVEFWSGETLWDVKSEYWIMDYHDRVPRGKKYALALNDAALDAIDADAD